MLASLVLAASTLAQAPAAPPTLADPALPAPQGPLPGGLGISGALSKLVVLVDAAGTRVMVDGDFRGVAPVSLDLDAGRHAVSFHAPGLPPFHVDVDVAAPGRTEVTAKIAQQRPAADFAQRKNEYDDAMFSVGWKGLGGLCGCGLGAAALTTAGIMLATPLAAVVPAATAIGGAAGCLGGTGLCGWAVLDVMDSPEEPIIPRVHVVKVIPPSGAADATVIEVEAPAVDSDGKPIDESDADPDADKPENDNGIVEAAYRY